jgi:hypothetical protein
MHASITAPSSGGAVEKLSDREQHSAHEESSGPLGWRDSYLDKRRVIVVAIRRLRGGDGQQDRAPPLIAPSTAR